MVMVYAVDGVKALANIIDDVSSLLEMVLAAAADNVEPLNAALDIAEACSLLDATMVAITDDVMIMSILVTTAEVTI